MINSFNCNNYISYSFLDYPDNKSLAIIFYMPGCEHHCLGCQNNNLKKYEGYEEEELIIDFLIKKCLKEHTNKLCLQGGDPLFKLNLSLTRTILDKMSSDFDICIYTGADIEEVKLYNLKGFKFIKCGIFDQSQYVGSKKTDTYLQFATKNQKLYNEDLNLVSKDGIYYF